MNVYHYLNSKGVSVYNTEDYLIENYGINFDALEERRQSRAVDACEKVLKEEGFDLQALYATI